MTIKIGVVVLNDQMNKKWFNMITIRRLLGAVVILCALLFLGLAKTDSAWQQKAKITAADGDATDYFGISVSISGDYAIVGSACDNDQGTDSGSVYIFKWDGKNWIQQQKLLPADGKASFWFGGSVSICGDYAVAGARYGDTNVVESGTAYVFWRNGNSWVQQAKLIAEDAESDDCFGISVSMNGDKAIVGAFCDDVIGSSYVFKRDGTTWTQQSKIYIKDAVDGDAFGRSVSISTSGDRVVIGADGRDDTGTDSGSVYVYKWNGRRWVLQQKLTAEDGYDYDWFGKSVAMSDDWIIVGAYSDDDKGNDSGSAYIFRWDGKNWVFQQKLIAADGVAYDRFGYSVSISGDYAIIGAYSDDDKGNDSGSAYIFKWDGKSWVQQQKLTASDGADDDGFGKSVSINGDKAILGALLDDDKGTNSGSAYIFTLTE
jgi:hypothetical protein